MNSLTDEERELLNDPEITEMLSQARKERLDKMESELAEHRRQVQLDNKMMQSYDQLISKGRVGKEWSETWKSFKEDEALLLQKMRTLCERLLYVEDDESVARERLVESSTDWFTEIKNEEQSKLRWLVNDNLWCQQYNEQFDEQWRKGRRDAAERKDNLLKAKSEAEIDEENIKALKLRLKRVM